MSQLKALLGEAGVDYGDCVEKADLVERAMQLSEVQGAAGRPAASMPPVRRVGSGGRGGHGQSVGGRHGGWGEVPYGDVVSMGGQLWYEAC